MRASWVSAAMVVGLLAGCADESVLPSGSGKPATSGVKPESSATSGAKPASAATSGDETSGAATAAPEQRRDEAVSSPAAKDQTSKSGVTRQVAKAGVGKKGRSLDGARGIGRIIAQPARSLFAVEQRMVFEVQIPQAMNLYKATNGRMPQSHKEFMDNIVKANNIKLPELPAGQRYAYDPKAEELMVEPAE